MTRGSGPEAQALPPGTSAQKAELNALPRALEMAGVGLSMCMLTPGTPS